MITAYYSVYGDGALFAESVRSVSPVVDEILVHYGRYAGFEVKNAIGTADFFRIVQSNTDKPFKFLESPAMTQSEKRSRMFQHVKQGYIFVIDDDDIFSGKSLVPKGPITSIATISTTGAASARLILTNPAFKYSLPWVIVNSETGEQFDLTDNCYPVADNCSIENCKEHRTEAYLQASKQYYQTRQAAPY